MFFSFFTVVNIADCCYAGFCVLIGMLSVVVMLLVDMLSVMPYLCYTECRRYANCRYAECHLYVMLSVVVMMIVDMLSVIFMLYWVSSCWMSFAECHIYIILCYAECHHAQSINAEFRYAQCQYVMSVCQVPIGWVSFYLLSLRRKARTIWFYEIGDWICFQDPWEKSNKLLFRFYDARGPLLSVRMFSQILSELYVRFCQNLSMM